MPPVRRALDDDDLSAAARLLHDFNVEFGDATPGPDALAARLRALLDGGDTIVLLGGPEDPEGLAVLRLRPALWSAALEAYLAELYVVPARRGHGLGRALLEAAMDAARAAGADHIDLGTSVDDVAARGLYERLGFTNREGGPDGPSMLYYERPL
jgi:ribosomal protein S18 acetylase RimI-like enzyme